MTDDEAEAIRVASMTDSSKIDDMQQQQPQPSDESAPNPLLQKYEEYRNVLKTQPEDFQTWTYLLSTVERMDEIEKIVTVFDEFLIEYPLCYGYWKKYADATMKHMGLIAATTIYERGIAAVPYSVDLWNHYVTFRMTKSSDPPEAIRSLFERGLVFVGTDYLSQPLWDRYIQHMMEHGDVSQVTGLYTRLLSVPFKDLESTHGKFQAFAMDHSLAELIGQAEVEALRLQQRTIGNRDADVVMQENGLQKAADDLMDADNPPDDEIKQRWLQSVADTVEATSKELTARKAFEDCIKRPYFHVKPLDNIQLQAWWKYLDYVSQQGSHSDLVTLFERCLVACASYPEFWMRYVMYMEAMNLTEAENIVRRTVEVFCKRKSEIYLFAAHFYERLGDFERSRTFLTHVTFTLAPSLLTGIIQHAAFEYRHAADDAGNVIYESKILAEIEKEDSEIIACLAIQYAHIQLRRMGSVGKAREILLEVLAKRADILTLWEGAIQIEELIQDEASAKNTIELYKKCVESAVEGEKGLTIEERYTMSLRRLHSLEFRGSAEDYGAAQRYHLKQFGLRTIAPSLHKKRQEVAQTDVGAGQVGQGGEATPTAGSENKTGQQATSSAAMAEFFAQNPAAQQYAQYYQYAAAAAAAAGYNAYTAAYSAPFSG